MAQLTVEGIGLLFFTLFAGLVAGLSLLPVISDLISLFRTRSYRNDNDTTPARAGQPRLLFLVPAHNEELLIGECLGALDVLDYPDGRYEVIVLADNCTDHTASVVQAHGAKCLIRQDLTNPGKPQAIAWALQYLNLTGFDAIVIIDGDSVIDSGYAQAVAQVSCLRQKAVQGYNGVSNPYENALTVMATLLSDVYYKLMYPLKQRAGLNPPLTGAGMCIGADVLTEHGWTAFSICEDVEMYVLLTNAGVIIEVAPEAMVRSQEAKTVSQAYSQRRRWRGGRLGLLKAYGRMILRSGRMGAHQKVDMIAELVMIGPATHAGLAVLLAFLLLVLQPPAWGVVFVGLVVGVARPVVYTLLALARNPAPATTLRAFLVLPLYAFWRLAVEVRAWIGAGDERWIRTRRDGGG